VSTQAQDLRPMGRSAPSQSWLDRLYALRDRLLASPDFQRFSAVFPLTRPIARKQAGALFDLCAGFVYSQVLAACVELELFRRVQAEPQPLDRLAADLAMPADRLERLLQAAVSLRLLSRRSQNRYGLGMLGAALVNDPGIAAMVRHHALLYRDLQNPVALLRDRQTKTELSQFWRYAGANGDAATDDVAPYSALMAASQSFIAADVLDAYDFSAHRCVMDVGGGEGAFVAAAAKKYPKLTFGLFDLPAVVELAETRLAAAGVTGRVTFYDGNFCDGPLPGGADLISLVRVVHDHDDPVASRLMRAAHEALPPGGKLLIAEPMAGVKGAEQVAAAYFGFYLLAMGTGRARHPNELAALLVAAGFKPPRLLDTRQPFLIGAMIAEK
jgi:demethylspheroidene O-methyltransferase